MKRFIVTPHNLREIEEELVAIFHDNGEGDRYLPEAVRMKRDSIHKILMKYVEPIYRELQKNQESFVDVDGYGIHSKLVSYEKIMKDSPRVLCVQTNHFNSGGIYGEANRRWIQKHIPSLEDLIDDDKVSIMAFTNDEFKEAYDGLEDYSLLDDDLLSEVEMELREEGVLDVRAEVCRILQLETDPTDEMIDDALYELENGSEIEWRYEEDYDSSHAYLSDENIKKVARLVKQKLNAQE